MTWVDGPGQVSMGPRAGAARARPWVGAPHFGADPWATLPPMLRRFVLAVLALSLFLHAVAHAGLGRLGDEPLGLGQAWLHHEQLAHPHPQAHEAALLQASPEALAHVLSDAVWCSPALLQQAPALPCVPRACAQPQAPPRGEHPHPFLAGLERPPRRP